MVLTIAFFKDLKESMKKAAIVTAGGIGDGLLFLPLRDALESLGFETTLFHSLLSSLQSWVQHHRILKEPQDLTTLFSDYDLLFLQHNNSPKSKILEKFPKDLFCFYGSYKKDKHPPFRKEYDYVCDPKKTMVENIEIATKLFWKKSISNQYCLDIPTHLSHRKHLQRVAIHPTGSTENKRWPKEKFLELFSLLKKQGLDPQWIVAPEEASSWPSAQRFSTLSDLSNFLYESSYMIGNDSGPSHLASFLKIPHLIIGGDGLNMPLWKPGWLQGAMITPSPYLMKYKALRKKWHFFIKTKKVLNQFNNSILNKH